MPNSSAAAASSPTTTTRRSSAPRTSRAGWRDRAISPSALHGLSRSGRLGRRGGRGMRERLSQLARTMPRWVRELKSVGLAIGFVLIVRTVAAEPFVIPSPSMVPTLPRGDELIATKHAYGYGKFSSPIGLMPDFAGRVLGAPPERGDVVVFR